MSLWIRLPWKTKNTCCKRAKCGHDNSRQHETQSSRGGFVPRAPTAHPFWCKLWELKGAFRWSSFVASFTCKTRFQETDSEWLFHVLHQALQAFPLKGDSTCSLCKSFASCADCCESALSISTFCCFLRFPELLLMR
ncbi:hypothetical protein BDL97_15G085300 [Sphagnum fallax]|nr:hypothetical protein BDL97_15G085300 [Sphagnum fallax]